jgi:predicted nucleic acid-binding protein
MAITTNENWLVFVDTNILLDFYRLGSESANRQLSALEKHKGSIITCEQVHMEYLKNRQKVIIENIKQLKRPVEATVPGIIADYQPAKTMAKELNAAVKKFAEVKTKIERILDDPAMHDPVYKSLKRLFDHDWQFNLKRPNPMRLKIRNLARKRFCLGYPPRKQSDSSIGDAINWEWIIHCAKASTESHNVLIVSRDTDYGIAYDKSPVLNDWLLKEFKDRVSQKRKIELTNRLTIALKHLDEKVSPEDEKEETEIIAHPAKNFTSRDADMDRYIKEMLHELDLLAKAYPTEASSEGNDKGQ